MYNVNGGYFRPAPNTPSVRAQPTPFGLGPTLQGSSRTGERSRDVRSIRLSLATHLITHVLGFKSWLFVN